VHAEGRSLEAAAHVFADRLNRLLNKTVTKARVVPAKRKKRLALALREGGEPGALLHTVYGPLVLSLDQIVTSTKVGGRHRLQTVRYRYSLAPDRVTEALVRWDYCRSDEHGDRTFCRRHLQGVLPIRLPKGMARLNDFHLPTGYVAIEDILRFTIVDLEVAPLSGDWDAILKESSGDFREQLYDADT
jgi:hypothetical protein